MVLLFVSGVMNLVWLAGIALHVAFENCCRSATGLSRAAGVCLIVSGAIVLTRAT